MPNPAQIAAMQPQGAAANRRKKHDRWAAEMHEHGWVCVPIERVQALVDGGVLPLTDAPAPLIDRIILAELTTTTESGV